MSGTQTTQTIKPSTEQVTVTESDARNFTLSSREVSKTVRKKAQAINFEQLQQLLLNNVNKNVTRTFTKYTKEMVQQYLESPASNLDNLREVSSFLWRVSSSYRKLIEYTSTLPLFLYNVTYISDWIKGIDQQKMLKQYQEVLSRLQQFNFKDDFSTIIATALRDGICIGLVYDNEDDGVMMQYLDPKYCKIGGKTSENNYFVKFNASYFDSGNNKEFLYGVNEDGIGVWDEAFIAGYEQFKSQGRDFQWFDLPIDRTICLLAGDDPQVPLPYYITIFTDLLDIIDYQSIIRSKTELQNFCLLYSQIPLIAGSEEVDDFALDIDTVQNFQQLIDGALPDLVGSAYGAAKLEPITFKDLNNTNDTDIVSQSISNLMSKVGISEMLWNDSKGGSVGLDASIRTDEAFAFRFMNKLNNWVNSYVKNVISDEFLFKFHPVSVFNQSTFCDRLEKQVAFGAPVRMDWLTAAGVSPYEAMCKTYMEAALDFNSLWIPPQSAYTSTGEDSEPGAPTKDVKSAQGDKTSQSGKNQGTKAKKNMK